MKMEDEMGNGGMDAATGADKKFSYKEFIAWLKLDATIVVKYSTMIPAWYKVAGSDPEESGTNPLDCSINDFELQAFEKSLMKDFGFPQELAMKIVSNPKFMDMQTYSMKITYKDFLNVLKTEPLIDYLDDKDTCGKTLKQLCGM
jgi:hypothetical protein